MSAEPLPEWKRIQKKTFTRWCNERLKQKNEFLVIEDISADFKDGVRLVILVEVLSRKSPGRYNLRPRVHAQCLENVQVALNFITKTEGIRLVNIGTGDIVKGNLKLILGLVWTLIQHYSIGFGTDSADGGSKKGGLTAKQALLQWIQAKIPQKNITNFTKDWNDGTAIAALTDAMAPGLCPENEEMDPANALQNATHAMKLSEDWLGVLQFLEPEDMVNPEVDELSMMTYLSQFPEAKLKPGAPLKTIPKGPRNPIKIPGSPARIPGSPAKTICTPKDSPKRVKASPDERDSPDASKCVIKGIETPRKFSVNCKNAGGEGLLEVGVIGCLSPCEYISVRHRGNFAFDVTYDVCERGLTTIVVLWHGQHIPGSPFTINI